MKVGRNDPCPCGSGKKYKRCCLGKDENLKYEQMPPQIPNESEYGEREFDKHNADEEAILEMARAYDGLRRIMLKNKPHIKAYNKIRTLHYEIVNSMAGYFYDGKFEQKIDPDYVYDIPSASENRRKEEILYYQSANFDTRSDFEERALLDLMIYKPAPNLSCITEEYINSHRYRKPEKIELLQSMLDSSLGLYEITRREPDEGYAYLRNVLTSDEYKLTDFGLSSEINPANVLIYARVITYRSVNFGTGFHLPFEKNNPFIINFIQRHKADYRPWAELDRFMELYGYFAK
ncbi:MAG: SEC-C domain-containing protein [Clostridiales bacterium]|jgi:hypothetical protein|nr:SEC-C domain-containing protein [Clostridiales bacterium]